MAGNVKKYVIKKRFLDKEIVAEIQLLDEGSITVLLSGGDKAHVGAVYVRDNQNQITRLSFEGHKDYVLAERWMSSIAKVSTAPIVITVGIHYDNIDLIQIKQIEEISDEMLKDCCLFIETNGGNIL